MINAVIRGNQNTTKLINELKKAARQYPTLSKDEEEELNNLKNELPEPEII